MLYRGDLGFPGVCEGVGKAVMGVEKVLGAVGKDASMCEGV